MSWKRWSGCTVGRTIRKKKDRRGRCVLTVKDFRIMQNKEVRNVHLWKKKRSARTVGYIVISRKWENRFDRSCVFQDQGCYYTIHSLQYGIWYAVKEKRKNKRKASHNLGFTQSGFTQSSQIISTHLLTVLIISAILQLEQRKGIKRKQKRKALWIPYHPSSKKQGKQHI